MLPSMPGAMTTDPIGMSPVTAALVAGLAAAAATALGTLPALFARRLERHVQDTLLGFGAGIMLAASAFSLVLPGLEEAQRQGAGRWTAGAIIGLSILAGAAMILALDHVVPHEHFIKGPEGGGSPVRL